jgi:hypothetical protein
VHALWGDLKSELGSQVRFYIPQKKRHSKLMLGAILEYKLAYSCGPAFADLRSSIASEAMGEINATNRTRARLAEHNLLKVHRKCQASLLVAENDIEMLLIAGELEVALAKRMSKPNKAKRFMETALSRFQVVYKLDPLAVEEYYARKRNVLFSLVQQDSRDPARAIVIQYIVSMLNRDGIQVESGWTGTRSSAAGSGSPEISRYPTRAAEYNLIRPIRDEGYSDSSGTLWQAMCLTTKEVVGIKIVDSSSWKRLGTLAQKIVKMRRKIKSEKIVHFLQVFEENNCTYFVMPLYMCSAFELSRANPEFPVRILFAITKLAIQALIELHAEGVIHGKVTMRNILITEKEDETYSITLTNKASHIINTVYHRLITGAHDSFSPQKSGWLNKTLLDYDSHADAGFENTTETDDDDGEMSSSDTTGTISLELRQGTLTEAVRKEAQKEARKSKAVNNPIHKSAKIVKAEDIWAVLRILARIRDMQIRRAAAGVISPVAVKASRGSSAGAAFLSASGGNNNNAPPSGGTSSFHNSGSVSFQSSSSEETEDFWSDLMPYIGGISVASSSAADYSEKMSTPERLPSLEELLTKRAFVNIADPARELTQYVRRHKMADSRSPPLMRSSNAVPSSTMGRDSSRRLSIAKSAEIEDPPTPPEELSFAAGSKREKLLAKLEEACKRHAKAGRNKKASFASRTPSSPRMAHLRTSLVSLVQNVVTANETSGAKRKGGLAGLFANSSSPPVHMPSNDEFDADWVVVAVVFFYNKTWLMWNALNCTCHVMEAGKGKWLWRSAQTGVVAALTPALYVRYLMGALHETIHRLNLLQSKLSFDLSSSQRMYAEFREHLRRLMRVYFHVAYVHCDHDLIIASPSSTQDSENSQSDSEPSTPRSPQSSPRPVSAAGKRTPGERTSGKRLSKGGDKAPVSKKQSVELPADVLWDLFHEFCTLFKVDISEQELFRKPLFL